MFFVLAVELRWPRPSMLPCTQIGGPSLATHTYNACNRQMKQQQITYKVIRTGKKENTHPPRSKRASPPASGGEEKQNVHTLFLIFRERKRETQEPSRYLPRVQQDKIL